MKPIKISELKEGMTYYAIDDRHNSLSVGYVRLSGDKFHINILDILERQYVGDYKVSEHNTHHVKSVGVHSLSDNIQFFELSKDEELHHIVVDEI